MKALNIITLVLIIVGGINWGLVGLADFNLVAAIFGPLSVLSRIIYILVGLSALWQIMPLIRASQTNEVVAEASHVPPRNR
ncbi:MAG: DUF378 domain-containing protein [Pseudomonadota bacterium]|nr:DUF378 domain-containing protein [Pseudomonadota bacterium]